MNPNYKVDNWIVTIRAGDDKLRLVCFPYAGGGAHVFDVWQRLLPREVGLHAVQLPGRGRRLMEQPLNRVEDIVPSVVAALQALPDVPTVFFGYSMGALIAFETARALRRICARPPVMLIVAAARPPQIEERERIEPVSDEELLRKLVHLGGTPAEVLQNRELLDMLLPALRADFALVDQYQCRAEPALDCPIVAICGDQDTHVSRALMAEWGAQTDASFSLHGVTGGHFFIHSARDELLSLVNSKLRPAAPV